MQRALDLITEIGILFFDLNDKRMKLEAWGDHHEIDVAAAVTVPLVAARRAVAVLRLGPRVPRYPVLTC